MAFQVELLDELRQVVGVGVHVVAVPRLVGSPVPAAVVCDAAEAARCEEEHLRVPIVSVKAASRG